MLREALKVREQGQPQGARGDAVALIHAGHGGGLAQDGSHAGGEGSQSVMRLWRSDLLKVPYICPPLPPGPPQCRASSPGLPPHGAALAISTLARRIPSNYTWPTSQAPAPKLFTQQTILAPMASPYHVFGTY